MCSRDDAPPYDEARPGACPARGPILPGDTIPGHRFDVQLVPVACSDCGIEADALYIPGTYIPRPAGYDPATARRVLEDLRAGRWAR